MVLRDYAFIGRELVELPMPRAVISSNCVNAPPIPLRASPPSPPETKQRTRSPSRGVSRIRAVAGHIPNDYFNILTFLNLSGAFGH